MQSSQVNRLSVHWAGAGRGGRARSGLGFTLIELLVVIVIVAILAAIAYPSYRSQVQKTRRADAKAVLMQGAQFMERGYTENGSYSVTGFPYSKSPIDGTAAYYTITAALKTGGTSGFTITAVGVNAEAGVPNLTLDDAGTRVGWEP